MKNKTCYKFLRLIDGKIKSENGNQIWEIGKWYKIKDELNMCHVGFHCSEEIYQAFSYVQGEILAEVEVRGEHLSEKDKEVWSEMKIIKAWKWQKKDSVALAIYSAELVLPNFEKEYPEDKRPRQAIEAAKGVLFEDTEENRSAAESAAVAALTAARSAALAARSAARSAAQSAALAALAAAESEMIKKISSWMDEHLKELEEFRN